MSKEKKGPKSNRIRTGNSFLDAISKYADQANAEKLKALGDPSLTDAQKAEQVAKANARIGFALNTSVKAILGQSSQRGFRR